MGACCTAIDTESCCCCTIVEDVKKDVGVGINQLGVNKYGYCRHTLVIGYENPTAGWGYDFYRESQVSNPAPKAKPKTKPKPMRTARERVPVPERFPDRVSARVSEKAYSECSYSSTRANGFKFENIA
jgi:hypothetical protein